MKNTKKTDLFRFVTVRTPQLLSKERRELGFVEHPVQSKSFFLKVLTGKESTAEARALVEALVPSYKPYANVSEVKDISELVWNFSLWLGKNKNNLDRATLEAEIPTVVIPSGSIIRLWDTVFYEILSKRNKAVRQACLQLIVASNFISKYKNFSSGSTTDEKELQKEIALLKRLANGKVVIPKSFTSEKSKVTGASIGRESQSFAKQERFHKAKVKGLSLDPLTSMRDELCAFKKRYQADEANASREALVSHEKTTDEQVRAYMEKQTDFQDIPDAEYTLPESLTTDFTFKYVPPLSPYYTRGKLATTTLKYIADNCLEEKSIESVIERVNKDRKETKKERARSKQKKYSEILVNGVLVNGNNPDAKEFTLSFDDGARPRAFFSLNTGYNGAFFKRATFKVSIGKSTFETVSPVILSNDDHAIFAEIIPAGKLAFTPNTKLILTADFELNNGKKLSVRKDGFTGSKLTSGVAYYASVENDKAPTYGVNRVGVADYRKVEQELCCYVAGEVSHIENILAKEYKEKGTRNLTSSETSITSTAEREMEDLTDTTSTSRHEMSSEIAEVITKDRNFNFGFNAGVDGKHPTGTWNASAHGDIAFGQSTSDSNSSARTFAEDVTRRALERIVQKTSLKRTSKIVREYEETSKHGFDNREGEKHVTGVYRWIDKIYKNRIVNYGKRLMYEFMLPEPAKFYKDAIIVRAEQEDLPSDQNGAAGTANVAVKPVHPRENGMSSSKDVTRENYDAIAALYDATVETPLDRYSNVSDSYAESIGNSDSPKSFNYSDALRVPEGYECFEIRGNTGYNFKARTGAKAYIKVHTASAYFEKTGYRGTGSRTEAFTRTVNNLTGAINVSVNTKKMTNFTLAVEVKCELKDSLFSQWQQDVYDAVMSAYNQQLQAFSDAQVIDQASNAVDQAANEDKSLNRNPKFNAEIVKTELKRLCIEMLTKPFKIQQGKDFYQNGACDVPQLKLSKELDEYSNQVKFFEQAFDWEIMSQLFYPYFWAKKCDWKALFQSQDSVDYIFQAFLQSGMGRVVVPVREGFEDAVTYFIETGEIWNGIGLAIDTDDELYLSIMDEVTLIEGDVEGEEWETVVPSSLTVVQARSVLLDEEGLPCCEKDADVIAELNLKPDENTLSAKTA